MKKLNKTLLLLITAGALGFSTSSFAVTDTIDLDATVPPNLEISEIEPVDLGTLTLGDGNNTSGDSNFCVGTNIPSNLYDVKIQAYKADDSALTAFELHSGANTLAYTVKYDNDGDGTAMTPMTEDVTLENNTGQIHACTTGVDNTKVRFTISAADMDLAEPGAYDGKAVVIVTNPA